MTALQTEVRGGELAIPPGMYMTSQQNMPWIHRIEEHGSWPTFAEIPETMVAYIPLSRFTVHHLLTLEKGKVFTSKVLTSDLVALKLGSVRLVWGEFEMVNQSLALRVTKLA